MISRDEYKIIVIDDDQISNLITETCITQMYNRKLFHCYEHPLAGVKAMEQAILDEDTRGIMLFLDINMPEMNGWQVLERLMPFLKNNMDHHIRIYMLSSSIDMTDKIKAAQNKYVSGYFEKPLGLDDFKDLIFKTNFLMNKDMLQL